MNYEIFKNKFLRKTLASWCAFATLATMCGPAFAVSGSYFDGAAVLSRTSVTVSKYNGSNPTATYAGFTAGGGMGVLDWNKLNVPASTTLEFNNGTFYNVVNSAGGMSEIAGKINASGASANVYIFNPNGVVFNSGSSVDVGGIFGAFATGVSGTTLDNWINSPATVPDAIKNATMSGDIEINGGTFKASQLAFAGENVRVSGGTFKNATTLVAGDRVTIDGFGDATITLTVPNADYGDIEFDGMSTFEDALVAKAGGSVNVGNNSKVSVKGDLDISAEAFHVDNSEVEVTDGKLTAQVSDRIAVMGTSSVHAKGDVTLTVADGNVAIADGFAASVKSEANVAITATGGEIAMDKGGEIVGQNITLNATGTGSHKDIKMASGASITANGKLDVTTDNGSITEDAGAKILATDNATFTAQNGDVTLAGTANDFSKGGVDKVVNAEAKTVTINEGAGDISLGAVKATAGDVKVTDTTGAITVNQDGKAIPGAASVTAEGTDANIELSAKKEVLITGASTITADKSVTIQSTDTGKITIDTTKNVTADAGDVTVETTSGDILVENATVQSKQGDVRLIALTANKATIQKSATVEATAGNVFIHADNIAVGDADTANNTYVKAGENIRVESPNGAVDIVSKVAAGKNLTIVSEKATAGSKVKIDAQYLTDKKILTAEDGSVYVVANANDIEINNGTIITATDATKTDSSAAGNILLKSELGSVTPAEGTATIVADNGKGVAAIVGGGTVGNKNLTIKAGVTVLNSTGKGVDTSDVKAVFEGDTKLVAKAVHDVDVDIVGGTLTIDSSANALAGENVNEYTPNKPMIPVTPHELKEYASDSRGAEAGNDIKITGNNANLVVADNSSAIAGHDITVNIDGNETVLGALQADNDIAQNIGGNITVSGTESAGNNITETIDGNSDVGGSVTAGKDISKKVVVNSTVSGRVKAGNDIAETIGGNSAVSGTVQAGRDVKSDVRRNTTISGTVKAGHNDYLTTGGNLATPGYGKIVAGKDLIVDVGTSTPQVNIAVGKGISAVSGERSIAFRTVGGYDKPEVYGNDSKTAVIVNGRIAGGNSADNSILQGYEQAAVFGNFFLMPVFTLTGNIFPLAGTTSLQSPDAAFAQGYLTSDKGEISGIGETAAE